MSWTLLIGLVLVLGLALFASITRRNDLRRMRSSVATRERAVRQGSAEAQLQHPVVDLTRCLGCGTCVAVCPEDGVLELVHGQAMVINGAQCVGVSACERECPVDAITVTLSNVETRNDIPAVTEDLEAIGAPGVFLAGEVTAHALIKTATEHGTAVGAEVARRVEEEGPGEKDVLDLCIIGAGPAGIACSLAAKQANLRALCLDQAESLGGTVAKYPRRKLVLTQPVDLPLHGRLKKTSYSKEELIDLWEQIVAEQRLPVRLGKVFKGIEWNDERGHYVVKTSAGKLRTRYVCLALGRRGVPRKLEVPGEDLPKVSYSLLDAHSFQGRRVLVVGGGDSAAETAVALAEQPGNRVTLSYRKASFFRLKSVNQQRLDEAMADGRVHVVFNSQVTAIHPDSVDLLVEEPVETAASRGVVAVRTGARRAQKRLQNDDVFIMAGGTPMTALLEDCGVSFDPTLRDAPPPVVEQGTGLVRALGWAFAFALIALVYVLWHLDYYSLEEAERTTHAKHHTLRPGLGLGLWFGFIATSMILVNLAYVLRRSPKIRFQWGSLQKWMTSHVGTGVLALLCALVHSAMAPGDSPGGHALWALVVLMVTGAIGRYFYAYVPRATNGRELELAEVKSRLGRLSEEWDLGHREFTDLARAEVEAIAERRQWSGSFIGRVFALIGVQFDLRRTLKSLALHGRAEGISEDRIDETLRLTREAHRTALMVAHYEDLRSVLNTWRWVHRWTAALLVFLVIVHVVHALTYGAFMQGGPR